MRYYNTFKDGYEDEDIARIACRHAAEGMDSYSDYGVGAALVVRHDHDMFTVYAGFNVNLSGMQMKIHAEQMALMNFVGDWPQYEDSNGEVQPVLMLVNTTEDDGALRCGHCLQVATAVCNHFGFSTDDFLYGSVIEEDERYKTEVYPLGYLMPEPYTEVRQEDGS